MRVVPPSADPVVINDCRHISPALNFATKFRTFRIFSSLGLALRSLSSGCCDSLTIAGAEDTHATQMGMFTVVPGVVIHSRPVYRNPDGQYLYYWKTLKNGLVTYEAWRIGADYTQVWAWVASRAGEGAACPNEAPPDWLVWTGSKWQTRPSAMRIACSRGAAGGPALTPAPGERAAAPRPSPPQPAALRLRAPPPPTPRPATLSPAVCLGALACVPLCSETLSGRCVCLPSNRRRLPPPPPPPPSNCVAKA